MKDRNIHYLMDWIIFSLDEFFLFTKPSPHNDYQLAFIEEVENEQSFIIYRFLIGADSDAIVLEFAKQFEAITLSKIGLDGIAEFEDYNEYWWKLAGTQQTAILDQISWLSSINLEIKKSRFNAES